MRRRTRRAGLALDLLALGDFLELGVDLRPLALVQIELGQAGLVVDWHGCLVLDRALNVVDRDVIAEDQAVVPIFKLERRAGEGDERGVEQRVAHVQREAIDKVAPSTACFVGTRPFFRTPR